MMKSTGLMSVLATFGMWANNNKNLIVATETDNFGDQWSVSLKGYEINNVDVVSGVVKITVDVPSVNGNSHQVAFFYHPEQKKLVLKKDDNETEWELDSVEKPYLVSVTNNKPPGEFVEIVCAKTKEEAEKKMKKALENVTEYRGVKLKDPAIIYAMGIVVNDERA